MGDAPEPAKVVGDHCDDRGRDRGRGNLPDRVDVGLPGDTNGERFDDGELCQSIDHFLDRLIPFRGSDEEVLLGCNVDDEVLVGIVRVSPFIMFAGVRMCGLANVKRTFLTEIRIPAILVSYLRIGELTCCCKGRQSLE